MTFPYISDARCHRTFFRCTFNNIFFSSVEIVGLENLPKVRSWHTGWGCVADGDDKRICWVETEVCVYSCMQDSAVWSLQSSSETLAFFPQIPRSFLLLQIWISLQLSPTVKSCKFERRDQWSSQAITTISPLARLKMNQRYCYGWCWICLGGQLLQNQPSWKLWESGRLGSWQQNQQTGIGMTYGIRNVQVHSSTTCTHYNITLTYFNTLTYF